MSDNIPEDADVAGLETRTWGTADLGNSLLPAHLLHSQLFSRISDPILTPISKPGSRKKINFFMLNYKSRIKLAGQQPLNCLDLSVLSHFIECITLKRDLYLSQLWLTWIFI